MTEGHRLRVNRIQLVLYVYSITRAYIVPIVLSRMGTPESKRRELIRDLVQTFRDPERGLAFTRAVATSL